MPLLIEMILLALYVIGISVLSVKKHALYKNIFGSIYLTSFFILILLMLYNFYGFYLSPQTSGTFEDPSLLICTNFKCIAYVGCIVLATGIANNSYGNKLGAETS